MDATRRTLVGSLAGLAAAGLSTRVMAAGAPTMADHPMVARVWHGRTPAGKTEAYRQYLYEVGVKKIATLSGNRGVQMWVAATPEGGEFTVVSYWDSIEAIKGYAGATYTHVHDLPRDHEFLIDPETLVHHFDVAVNFWQV